ncbi:hypothetical protein DPF_0857 [Desulfoplanes formicivorans]|uniref:Uncharacterized protein n=1 Tax=Desulfoplanes formicivorans TaxID=1592317 RepID=A0A194AHB9_9BACT|nr:hypothetical protein DPF_0857 [Desulfoplanes formicivorans]
MDHGSELIIEIRKDCLRQRGRAVLLALAVMDSEDHSVKVDILHPQFLAFEEPELATI